jgi:excisionase family DNA binding protein
MTLTELPLFLNCTVHAGLTWAATRESPLPVTAQSKSFLCQKSHALRPVQGSTSIFSVIVCCSSAMRRLGQNVVSPAERRSVRRQAILVLISRKRLKAYRVGREWLIREKDLDAFSPLSPGRPRKRTPKSKASKTRRNEK